MFILGPHLVFLLAIAGVGLANQSPPFAVALVAAYGIGLYHTYRKGRSIRPGTETALAVLAAGVSLAISRYQGQHYLFSLSYLLALILVIRSFRRMEKRHYGFCFLGAAVILAHVARTYEEMPFLVLVLAAIVVLPYALFQFLSHYGGFGNAGVGQPSPAPAFSAAHFRLMAGVSAALLLASTALFLVMPRARGSSMFGAMPEEKDKRTTGLSDNVSLGSFSEVTSRRTIVMTVESEQPALWRGGVLDYYENGVWYGAAKQQERRPGDAPPSRQNARTVSRRFQIFDVRLTGLRLPSAGTVLSVRQPNGDWDVQINDVYSTVAISDAEAVQNRGGNYEVVSDAGEFVGSGDIYARQWPIPTARTNWMAEQDLFLQTPADLSDRVTRLAQDLTRGLNSPEEKAKAIQRHLSQGFTYRVRRLESGNMQPLDYFLFQSKAGHCEYFASAMAILLRCAGVRTRVVQGFTPGTLVGGKYVVRLKDAHLWTEVFYPGKGWKTFDPTPGQGDRLRMGEPMDLIERLNLKWQTYVLGYDRGVQVAMFRGINHVTVTAFRKIAGMVRSSGLLLATIPVLCLVFLLVRFRRRLAWLAQLFRRGGTRESSVSRARNYFGQYLREIARRGYRRAPATTPNDLLAALRRDRTPIVDEADFLTRLFYEMRFGEGELSTDMEKGAELAVRRIRDWAR